MKKKHPLGVAWVYVGDDDWYTQLCGELFHNWAVLIVMSSHEQQGEG